MRRRATNCGECCHFDPKRSNGYCNYLTFKTKPDGQACSAGWCEISFEKIDGKVVGIINGRTEGVDEKTEQ